MAAAVNTRSVADDTGLLEASATRRVPRRRAVFTFAPWILTLVIAAVAGLGGYYGWQKYDLMKGDVTDARGQIASLNQRAAAADDRAMKASAELSKTRAALITERDTLKVDLDQMKAKADKADVLAAKLDSMISKDQGKVTQEADGRIRLELMDKILFRSGEADLTKSGMKVLQQVGAALKEFKGKQVWVQGHTDDLPIANEQFGSNWELSAARALNVVHYLQDDVGVNPKRLAAVAFGQYRAVSRKRRRNRRIEIVLFPKRVKLTRRAARTAARTAR